MTQTQTQNVRWYRRSRGFDAWKRQLWEERQLTVEQAEADNAKIPAHLRKSTGWRKMSIPPFHAR